MPSRRPPGRLRRASVALAVAGVGLHAMLGPAAGGDSGLELVPEVNAFIRVAEHARVFLLADLAHEVAKGATDAGLGVHLDVTLTPIFRPNLRTADWDRDRYLWLRVGYQLAHELEGRGAPTEHRGVFELTARAPLPWQIWLTGRSRADLREIDGEVSARARFRAGLERELVFGGLTLVPYLQAEIFYDTRFGAWNRQLYQGGVEIELTKHLRVEPYYARQEDQRSSPAHVDRLGLVLKLYW